eukprot:TRINITY_DN30886_c0_g1_i1.p1 TRINITY_DN30886_c0_g1~~TRINITY_DN30886_c0_g1_i1.p1  ORF type:complete len:523 (-),score=160.60 TRINITY_DN30886_c0_g1_i1:8-1576(-)
MPAGEEVALLAWVNRCGVLDNPASLDDLSDGVIIQQVLHHFVPERFGSPDAQPGSMEALMGAESRMQDLQHALDRDVSGHLARMTREHEHDHRGLGGLVLSLLEAAFMACVHGSNKAAVVGKIMELDQASQFALMSLIQKHAQNATAEGQSDEDEEGDTVPELEHRHSYGNRHSQNLRNSTRTERSSFSSTSCWTKRTSIGSLDRCGASELYEQLQDLHLHVHREIEACRTMEQSERSVADQLHKARMRCYGEEEMVADSKRALDSFMKEQSGELASYREHITQLRDEVHDCIQNGADSPERELAMRKRYQSEVAECEKLGAGNNQLESEINEVLIGLTSDKGDGGKEELDLAMKRMQEELADAEKQAAALHSEESCELEEAQHVWEEYSEVALLSEYSEQEATYFRRLCAYEGKCEQDAVGMLDFRKMELSQAKEQQGGEDGGGQVGRMLSTPGPGGGGSRRDGGGAKGSFEQNKLQAELLEAQRHHEEVEQQCAGKLARFDAMEVLVCLSFVVKHFHFQG